MGRGNASTGTKDSCASHRMAAPTPTPPLDANLGVQQVQQRGSDDALAVDAEHELVQRRQQAPELCQLVLQTRERHAAPARCHAHPQTCYRCPIHVQELCDQNRV